MKEELALIRRGAELIRRCKDDTVREAALDFVEQCNVIADKAFSLVANCDLMLDESKPPGVREIAEREANREAGSISNDIHKLSSHLSDTSEDAIGGHPKVVDALGSEAIAAMNVDWGENPLLVAQQIKDVFEGANRMAKFVGENYKN